MRADHNGFVDEQPRLTTPGESLLSPFNIARNAICTVATLLG